MKDPFKLVEEAYEVIGTEEGRAALPMVAELVDALDAMLKTLPDPGFYSQPVNEGNGPWNQSKDVVLDGWYAIVDTNEGIVGYVGSATLASSIVRHLVSIQSLKETLW